MYLVYMWSVHVCVCRRCSEGDERQLILTTPSVWFVMSSSDRTTLLYMFCLLEPKQTVSRADYRK